MANLENNINSSGGPLYHLRRIGRPASKDGVVDVMDFYKSVYMIGRNASHVDFYIDSSSHIQSQSLSRCHARIVRQDGNKHRLYDDSLNGVFINNMKISASCILQEGDKVIFGHPKGARILPGTRSRQPNSEHQFIFEICNCKQKSSQDVQSKQETFKKPTIPQIGSPESLNVGRKYQHNKKLDTNVQEDNSIQENLSDSAISSSSPSSAYNNTKLSSSPSYKQNKSLTTSEEIIKDEQNPSTSLKSSPHYSQSTCITKKEDEPINSLDGEVDHLVSSKTDLKFAQDCIAYHEPIGETNEAVNIGDIGKMDTDSEVPESVATDDQEFEASESSDQNTSALEDAVNLILNELTALRGSVEKEYSTGTSANSTNTYISPTKDACIQTSQKVNLEILSPTKDMGIQTSQILPSDSSTVTEAVPNSLVISESSVNGDSAVVEMAEKVCDNSVIEVDIAIDSINDINKNGEQIEGAIASPKQSHHELDGMEKAEDVCDTNGLEDIAFDSSETKSTEPSDEAVPRQSKLEQDSVGKAEDVCDTNGLELDIVIDPSETKNSEPSDETISLPKQSKLEQDSVEKAEKVSDTSELELDIAIDCNETKSTEPIYETIPSPKLSLLEENSKEKAEKVCDDSELELDIALDSSVKNDGPIDETISSPKQSLHELDSVDKHPCETDVDNRVKCDKEVEDLHFKESTRNVVHLADNDKLEENNDGERMDADLDTDETECAVFNTSVDDVNGNESDLGKTIDSCGVHGMETECSSENMLEKNESEVDMKNFSKKVDDTDNVIDSVSGSVCTVDAYPESLECNTIKHILDTTTEQAKTITNSIDVEVFENDENEIRLENDENVTRSENDENETRLEDVENLTKSENDENETRSENVTTSENDENETRLEDVENLTKSENDENETRSENVTRSENDENETRLEDVETLTKSENDENETRSENVTRSENDENETRLEDLENVTMSENDENVTLSENDENETRSENDGNLTTSENETRSEIDENESTTENVETMLKNDTSLENVENEPRLEHVENETWLENFNYKAEIERSDNITYSEENVRNGTNNEQNEAHPENGTSTNNVEIKTQFEVGKSLENFENKTMSKDTDKRAGIHKIITNSKNEPTFEQKECNNSNKQDIEGNTWHIDMESVSENVEIESKSDKTDDNTNSEHELNCVNDNECILLRNTVSDKNYLAVDDVVKEKGSDYMNEQKTDSMDDFDDDDNEDNSDVEQPDSPKMFLSNSIEYSDEYSDNESTDESDGYEEINLEENEVLHNENKKLDEKIDTVDGDNSVDVPIIKTEDGVKVKHEENVKKRKMSSEISDSDSDNDALRKRHCSEVINISDDDGESLELPDIDFNDEEDNFVKVQKLSVSENLKKLNDGMKNFFDLNFTKSCINDCSEEKNEGYIFLQDNSGKISQFQLDFPVSGQDNGDDNDNSGEELENVTTEIVSLDNKALGGRDTEGDDVYHYTDVQVDTDSNCVSAEANDELEMRIDDENLAIDKHDIELNKNEKHEMDENDIGNHELGQNGKHVIRQNVGGNDTMIVNETSPVSSGKSENVDNSFVETSQINETCNDNIVSVKLLKDDLINHDPVQSDDFQENSNSSTSSPVIEKCDTNLSTWLRALPLLQTNEKHATGSDCEFSMDEDEHIFPSPKIDFNYLSDNDNDLSVIDDPSKANDTNGNDKAKMNGDSDIDNDHNDITKVNDNSDIDDDNDDNKAKSINNDDSDIDNDNNDADDYDKAKSINSDFDSDGKNDSDDQTDVGVENEDENVNTAMDVDESIADDTEGNDTDIESNLDDLLNSDKLTVDKNLDDRKVNDKDRLKRSSGYEVDFDFCDSESEDISSLDNGADVSKESSKRHAEFEHVDQLWKKPKTDVQHEELNASNSEVSISFKVPLEIGSRFMNGSESPRSRSMSGNESPGSLSCTQLIESSQSPDLSSLSSTQITSLTNKLEEKAKDIFNLKSVRTRAKSLIEKLRAKRRVKEEAANDSPTPGSSTSNTSNLTGTVDTTIETRRDASVDDIHQHVKRCRNVIDNLKTMFNECVDLHDNIRVQAWRKELNEVQKLLEFPKTVIAVVGNTGAGKSSLMNAVLDQRNVLPTSGIRACTAVVVEVIENTTSDAYIASIEFLQRKEWFDELEILLNDLKGSDGTVKNRSPDPTSDAYISYCKVKAVYGRVDDFHVLSRLTSVTLWLGRVKVITSQNAEDFRKQVEKYVETQEPGNGGQYWPIVKHVTLKIPNCNVCSTGASLVDLPGIRDSNAARDKIARQYLKNCTAVWVVSSIERAIDDKTAKDLLGENFRRQLLMDGQYGSIAFICTKTDVITPSEIIRSLKLKGKTEELAEEIKNLESEKCDLDLQILRISQEIKELTKSIKDTKKEVIELRENLQELKSLLNCEDPDSSQSEEKEAVKEYEDELKQKETELVTMTTRIDSLTEEKNFASQKTLEKDGLLNTKRRDLTSMCAKARNDYSKSQIKRDFKAGLKEMKRRAGVMNDQEDDIYDDDDDDNDGDIGSSADNLRVFCCSSTEYQKMKNLSSDDGPPVVFSTETDTQIPQLRQYVHEMTNRRRKQAMENLIRTLGSYVFDIKTYILESGNMNSNNGYFVKSVIDMEVDTFHKSLEPVIQTLNKDLDAIFDGSIKQKLNQGANNAKLEANQICTQWGAPVNRNPKNENQKGGLHWATYRAAVNRNGVFKSSSPSGNIDFNEDLAEPMYRCMTIVWDRAFNGLIWKAFEQLQANILFCLQSAYLQLYVQLEKLDIPRDRIDRVCAQLKGSVSNKLKGMVDVLKEKVSNNQRDISRLITPHIQSSLTPLYTNCSKEKGPGMYKRMKASMEQGIDYKRCHMFDEATLQLMQALIALQNEIVEYVKHVCQVITADILAAFEPLWNTPGNSNFLRSALMNKILGVCSNVREIYKQAKITNTEETTVPTLSNTSVTTHDNSISDNRISKYQPARVKVEETNGGDTPIENSYSGNYNLEIKQERNTFNTNDGVCIKQQTGDLSRFGVQTLQNLQAGKLDISPVEVTVQSTPTVYHGQSKHGERMVHTQPSSRIDTRHSAFLSTSHSSRGHRNIHLLTSEEGRLLGQPSVIPRNKSVSGQQVLGFTKSATNSANNSNDNPIMYFIQKENVVGRNDSVNQPMVSLLSSQNKGPLKPNKSLSLSQRNTGDNMSIPTTSVVNIKSEPADNGSYGTGRRRPRYLGTIDLTDD